MGEDTDRGSYPESQWGADTWIGQDTTTRIRITDIEDVREELVRGLEEKSDPGDSKVRKQRLGLRETMPAPPGILSSNIPGLSPITRSRAPRRGEKIADRYQIHHPIGEGGMGCVYEVSHLRLQKSFALKLLHPHLSKDIDMKAVFFQEAQYASSLEHPNMVNVVDYGDDLHFGPYLVMELLSGETLSDHLLDRKTLSIKKSCDIIAQIAEGLSYMHGRDLVHCDLKPQNIMLIPQESTTRKTHLAKLLDFGFAQNQSGMQSGVLVGTPAYTAPEMAQHQRITPAADVYSLGILFYELLTGRVPWTGRATNVLSSHIYDTAPPLSEAAGKPMDEALEKLLAKALSKGVENRHPTMAAFLYELRTFMKMNGLSPGRRGRATFSRQEPSEADLVQEAFEGMRLPLATISNRGEILVANAAFSRFFLGVRMSMAGTLLQDTALGPVWPNLENDLRIASSGQSLGRRVEIAMTNGSLSRLQMWLSPSSKTRLVISLHPED